jgi:NADH dehydrogenase (ubiquinone) Fe-S protein 8
MSFIPPRLLVPVGVFRSIAATHARAFPISRRLQSTHTQRPPHSTPNYLESADGLISDLTIRKHHRERTPRTFDAQGNELDPYKDGPSAIDKAVHLFFFTEILRGPFAVVLWLSRDLIAM